MPGPALPRLATPRLAMPRQAKPRPVMLFAPGYPLLPRDNRLIKPLPRLATPSHAKPSLAEPRPALPRPARPCRVNNYSRTSVTSALNRP